MFNVPNQYRKRDLPGLAKQYRDQLDEQLGNNGMFNIPHPKVNDYVFRIIASDGSIEENGLAWEHVSVSVAKRNKQATRCPTWEEMCHIKKLFWNHPEDVVIQYHPAESEYISMHPFVLHLWRPVGIELPKPDKLMIGINLK